MDFKQFKISCENTKALLIGDVMLDRYVFGKVNRISPEAPVPIFLSKDKKQVLGGAGNVFNNLVSLDVNTTLLTVLGNDVTASHIKKILKSEKKSKSYIFTEKKISSSKTRYLVNGQQLIRVDEETSNEISYAATKFLLSHFKEQIKKHNVVVISDYNKGIFTKNLLKKIIALSKKYKIPVIVDPKNKDFNIYEKCTLITPNQLEISQVTNLNCDKDYEAEQCGKYIIENFKIRNVLITRGEKGLSYINKQQSIHSATTKKEVFDVSGAGDTVLAIISICLANNILIKDALNLANKAAGIVVGKIGTSAIKKNELFSCKSMSYNKILNKKQLIKLIQIYKKKNIRIGFTNGCFDILHQGHVNYLEESKKLCDILIIAINSDISVKVNKGKNRPINDEKSRAKVLASLSFCDHIIIFNEKTPLKIINLIKPDIITKGGDYKESEIIGAKQIKKWNGKVNIIKFTKGASTTNIIKKLPID
jgi:D-beta-D-heptose 7-phosphate kinase/D-beta-D-heptose 1-phosphate adenosyltransferase